MIVLRSPKGWTGPKVVDGLQIEGTFRSHQVPLLVDADHPEHVELLELDEELQARGAVRRGRPAVAELAELAPRGDRRMGANPHTNGGMLLRTCGCRTSATTRSRCPPPARSTARTPSCSASSSVT
jgi:xylulose-5-phosphate/fructose-6-phosphate phosphoketolase